MILQELVRHYDRLTAEGSNELPPEGFSREKIHFVLRIDRDGNALNAIPLTGEDAKGKTQAFQERIVPKYKDRANDVFPFFLWDKTAYVVGVDPTARSQRLTEQFVAFKGLHHAIGDHIDEPEMRAVLGFLDGWSPEMVDEVPGLRELIGGNLVFEVAGFNRPVFENPVLRNAWLRHMHAQLGGTSSVCLATGETTKIARTHPKIRGVFGSQTSGAAIVSFNDDAYTSYGKTQSYNAPVGAAAAEKYTKMLNYLLRRGSRNVVRIGDTSVVFWCETQTPLEGGIGMLMGRRDDDTIGDDTIRAFLMRLKKGLPYDFEPDRRFFILGLAAPSKSRLSVRYWYQGTTGELADRLRLHLQDTDIISMWDDDPVPPSVWHMLISAVLGGDAGNIDQRMQETLMRAILFGTPYPRRLYSAILDRIRVGDRRIRAFETVRAGIIRGYLKRRRRSLQTQESAKEVPIMLQRDTESAPYQLGRLFAVYEKIQKASFGTRTLNRTIRDRFYASASTTPRRSFATITKLSIAHQKKLPENARTYYDKLLQEIADRLHPDRYPSRLSQEDQGLFALGYYHQRKELFTPKGDATDAEQTNTEE